MARQSGKTKLVGRIGDVVYYKMDGKYYARAVSSLSGRRVKRDPKFKRTMEFAKLFGIASKLASELHRSLPFEKRSHKLYRKMTGRAYQLLKNEMEQAAVTIELKKQFWPEDNKQIVQEKVELFIPVPQKQDNNNKLLCELQSIPNGKTASQNLLSPETRRQLLPYHLWLAYFRKQGLFNIKAFDQSINFLEVVRTKDQDAFKSQDPHFFIRIEPKRLQPFSQQFDKRCRLLHFFGIGKMAGGIVMLPDHKPMSAGNSLEVILTEAGQDGP
ncbi:hypothetical protein [Pseudobacter ginsenosidimutans]|uniref:Uncharacterized protein n=1 Tax=Pseudobacter ginsenosidimutans TaxID=661488 RepID=A0A4Q7N569_9BACT|nr:hypothetical protein [Pseudobacter ginsenosidimutans]QEC44701.1 hypothetical protein FSB84_24575 [Pseudobacter ginsenosidimutans]RZS76182.1 hypothetical protein EV199_2061 [Pseudobacter ginsenosidimutans]